MEWVPVTIDGFSDKYEVSRLGFVRSVRTGKVLKPMRTGCRRPGAQRSKVRFSTSPRRDFDVAHLVLSAFVGPRPLGCVAMHADDDSTNNAVSNLAWGTPQQNGADCAARTRCAGQKIGPLEVGVIRRARESGVSGSEIARRMGVSPQRVCDIYKGRSALVKHANK